MRFRKAVLGITFCVLLCLVATLCEGMVRLFGLQYILVCYTVPENQCLQKRTINFQSAAQKARNKNSGKIVHKGDKDSEATNNKGGEEDDLTIRELQELEKYMKEINSEWEKEEEDQRSKH